MPTSTAASASSISPSASRNLRRVWTAGDACSRSATSSAMDLTPLYHTLVLFPSLAGKGWDGGDGSFHPPPASSPTRREASSRVIMLTAGQRTPQKPLVPSSAGAGKRAKPRHPKFVAGSTADL